MYRNRYIYAVISRAVVCALYHVTITIIIIIIIISLFFFTIAFMKKLVSFLLSLGCILKNTYTYILQFSHRRYMSYHYAYCFNSLWKQSPKLKLDTHIKAICLFFILFLYCRLYMSYSSVAAFMSLWIISKYIYMKKKYLLWRYTPQMMFVVVLIKTRNVTINCWMWM